MSTAGRAGRAHEASGRGGGGRGGDNYKTEVGEGHQGWGSKAGAGEWKVVSRKRKWSPSVGRGAAGVPNVLRDVKCFRCLGWGHFAVSYKEPPKCWRCGGWGHRSTHCSQVRCTPVVFEQAVRVPRPGPVRDEDLRKGGGVVEVPGSHVKAVTVEWSPALASRMEIFGRSHLMKWQGIGKVDWEQIVGFIRRNWKESKGMASWALSPSMAFLRLPSQDMTHVLEEKDKLLFPIGEVIFLPCNCGVGGRNGGGMQVEVLLRGLPLLWRTEEVLRKVVGVFDHLVEASEFSFGDEEPLLVKAGVYVNVGEVVPEEVVVSLDGWRVVVKVELKGRGDISSYAEVARGREGGGDGPSKRMGCNGEPEESHGPGETGTWS
ncbi:hypothetical protein QJS10_CPB21g01157 [Acorus calamus]|uniref:CCHC-type domain-containing protein n=1 Tax=Acorus calamus TaxID=4465 RepID=A0AAV9C4U7_ACOCL|nr:hypothetical protein QJS10_CPB21g01157 [Acorus calamus]